MIKAKKPCFTCSNKTNRKNQTMTHYECLKCYETKRIKIWEYINKRNNK